MRYFILLIINLAFITSLNSQTLNHKVIDQKGKEKLLGKVDREGLTSASFGPWFSEGYRRYKPDKNEVRQLRTFLSNYEITVFLGTWCGDSRREVPRFYKILDKAKYPEKRLRVIGLDNQAKTYKQSPAGEEKGLNIHRVPTFIVYQNGEEVGRIVESPVVNLENDLVRIIHGKDYEPNYRVVTQVNQLLETRGVDYLKENAADLEDQFKQQVESINELNTYAYVLLWAGNKEAALEIFKINAKLFSKEGNAFFSLGRGYEMNGKKELALLNYKKALEINPDNQRIHEVIKNIREGQSSH